MTKEKCPRCGRELNISWLEYSKLRKLEPTDTIHYIDREAETITEAQTRCSDCFFEKGLESVQLYVKERT